MWFKITKKAGISPGFSALLSIQKFSQAVKTGAFQILYAVFYMLYST